MNCPIHNIEFLPDHIEMTSPEKEEVVLRSTEYHNPDGMTNIINNCIGTFYKDKDIYHYKCPCGCTFSTTVMGEIQVSERWEKSKSARI